MNIGTLIDKFRKTYLKNLTDEQLIKLCELRLSNENIEFTEIKIEDKSFTYLNGVSFIIKSEKFRDFRHIFSFDKFYPEEFIYIMTLEK